MKIKLTAEQKNKMEAIFNDMEVLSKDADFMKQLKYAEDNCMEDNDDSLDLANFVENIIDNAKYYFNYHNI